MPERKLKEFKRLSTPRRPRPPKCDQRCPIEWPVRFARRCAQCWMDVKKGPVDPATAKFYDWEG